MKYLIFLFCFLVIYSTSNAAEYDECVTYLQDVKNMPAGCEKLLCRRENCAIASVHCKDPSLYYETAFDSTKDFPECCPKYGCKPE